MLVAEDTAVSELSGDEPVGVEEDEGGSERLPPLLPVSRWVLAAFGAVALLITFTQDPGLIEFDSKLPMLVTPLSFFSSSLHLWNQNIFAGTADVGTGFLLPMGFFFSLTHILGIPVWVAERLWLALVLTTGFWGVVRLAEALHIGNRWGRVLAGVAYISAPLVITWVSVSDALLAVVLLPWMLVPLVTGSREGSPRRAAARSGVIIALMGGSNAAVILAVLPLAVIWLVTRRPGPRRRALIFWWIIATGLACFWWVMATLFTGKYGYNYLPYTETAQLTTSTASVFESLRGASFWVDYFNLGGPLLPGPWFVVSTAAVVVGSAVATALALAGLARRIPEKLFLIISLAFGVLVISAGFSGASGGIFSHTVQRLLEEKAAPFRNITKFAPDVALPLALGLAWMVSVIPWEKARTRAGRLVPSAKASIIGIGVVAIVAVGFAATPYARQDLYKPGGFKGIPNYWVQAGKWLNTHAGHGNVLLVPGSTFADYTWGNPIDESLQVVTNASIEYLSIIPLGSNGFIEMQDAVEQALDSGTSPPGLMEFLARAGIDYIVERNDLNLSLTGAPPPAQVHQVLAETPGLTEVKEFGPRVSANQVEFGSLPIYDSPYYQILRSVEIFRVGTHTSVVRTYPVANPVIVSGDVGSLLPLSGAGVITGRATVLAGDSLAPGVAKTSKATLAITDGNQRRLASFGGIRYNQSYVLNADQSGPGAEAGVPLKFSVVPGVKHQTVESPIGAKSVNSSSYGSSPITLDPSDGPGSAFDGDIDTSWVADAQNNSVGQWVSITFNHALNLSTITYRPLVGSPEQPTVSRVTITTDRGSVIRDIPDSGAPVTLSVPRGKSSYLKLTLTDVRQPKVTPQGGIVLGAGITDVAIPGARFQQQMKLPDDESKIFNASRDSSPVVVLNRPIANANLALGLTATEDPVMARQFTLNRSLSAKVTGYATPVQSAHLEKLIEFLSAPKSTSITINASSWLGGLPRFRPENLLDGQDRPWIANLNDSKPSVTLSWPNVATIDSVDLKLSALASRPATISILSLAGVRTDLAVPANGHVTFPALKTNSITIRFDRVIRALTLSPNFGVELTLPVGLKHVSIPGVASGLAPVDTSTPVSLPCGQGPPLLLDGRRISTSVSGTLGDLVDLKPMRITACDAGVALSAGTHTFQARNSSSPFQISSVVMEDAAAASTASTTPAQPRTTKIVRWSAENRTINVGPGSAAAFLTVAQNYNAAWVAKLGGVTLKPVRIDGWQQGYIVPAGKSGNVSMVMVADRTFQKILLLGALFLVLLVALALFPARRRVEDEGGPASLPSWLLFAGAFVVLGLVAGPLALVIIPLALIARRWGPGPMSAIAFVAFVAAGIAAAWHPAGLDKAGADAFGRQAQIASVIALAAVFGAVVGEKRIRRKRSEADVEV